MQTKKFEQQLPYYVTLLSPFSEINLFTLFPQNNNQVHTQAHLGLLTEVNKFAPKNFNGLFACKQHIQSMHLKIMGFFQQTVGERVYFDEWKKVSFFWLMWNAELKSSKWRQKGQQI